MDGGSAVILWFWYFVIYSFLGFLTEVAFARLTRNPKRDRKCRYFLPLCPVYGLGAIAILLLPEPVRQNPLLLFPCSALVCTAVEYGTGLFYETFARVSFWDYSHLPLNLGGRVCLLFALFWGFLALALLRVVHPVVERLTALLPPWLFVSALLFTLLDGVLTFYVLRRARDTGALRWYLRAKRHAA